MWPRDLIKAIQVYREEKAEFYHEIRKRQERIVVIKSANKFENIGQFLTIKIMCLIEVGGSLLCLDLLLSFNISFLTVRS